MRSWLKYVLAHFADQFGLLNLRRRRRGVIVFMLHKVNDKEDLFQITLKPDLLSEVVREVSQFGECIRFEDITPSILADSKTRFCFTFDDGYKDNYTNAFPVFRQLNVPATIFLTTGFIGTNNIFWYEKLGHFLAKGYGEILDLSRWNLGVYKLNSGESWEKHAYDLNRVLKSLSSDMRDTALADIGVQLQVNDLPAPSEMLNWEEVKEMASSLISFGSHTVTHPILSRESEDTVREELSTSRREIERVLGREISSLAYPNGTREDFDPLTIQAAMDSGYDLACTTIQGRNDRRTSQMEVRRMHVHNGMCTDKNMQFSPAMFWSKTLNLL